MDLALDARKDLRAIHFDECRALEVCFPIGSTAPGLEENNARGHFRGMIRLPADTSGLDATHGRHTRQRTHNAFDITRILYRYHDT